MVEATNFVEKTLGKNTDVDNNAKAPEIKESAPTYTPPPPPMRGLIQAQQDARTNPQVVEKIVYKKQRIHGFFRTLTIIALLAIGFLMLGESTGIIQLSINTFKLHQVFPIFIILSSIIIWSYKGIFGKIFGLILFLAVFGWIFTIGIYTWLNPSSKRKSGENMIYTIVDTGNTEQLSGTTNTGMNIYLETLIGNTSTKGSTTGESIQTIWNSDRNLLVLSGEESGTTYLKFNEDNNRNVLQSHTSNSELILPATLSLDLLYIKNLLWSHIIDLDTFQRKTLKFHAGIDNITINIGNVLSGNKIEIQWTATNIQLNIPKDIGVMMYYKHLVGTLETPDFDPLSGHYFQSKNIATAKSTLNIYINLGIWKTKIHRTEEQKH